MKKESSLRRGRKAGANGHVRRLPRLTKKLSKNQGEFGFMTMLASDRVVEERQKSLASGGAAVARPALFNCEIKPSLRPDEAAFDLDCTARHIEKLMDLGKLRWHSISAVPGEACKRDHRRVHSSSVAEVLNNGGAHVIAAMMRKAS